MKRTSILACCLFLVAVAGLAQTPAPAADLAFMRELSLPAACPSPGLSPDAIAVAHRPSLFKNTCTAICATGTVSCTGTGTCTAVDRACPSERGYVTCDGTTTFCPTTCPICTDGSTRSIPGGCCTNGTRKQLQQQCVNGTWQTVGSVCSSAPCGPTPVFP